jgi:hypothetical protein
VPVTVASVKIVKPVVGRVKNKMTTIVIQFSGVVNAGTAANVANYQLESLVRIKRKGHFVFKPQLIPLARAAYESVSHSVTLSPRQPLAKNVQYHLRIVAAGLLDSQGRALDGDRDGLPGGDFGATLENQRVVFDPVG